MFNCFTNSSFRPSNLFIFEVADRERWIIEIQMVRLTMICGAGSFTHKLIGLCTDLSHVDDLLHMFDMWRGSYDYISPLGYWIVVDMSL